MPITFGIDSFLKETSPLKAKKIALVCNDASITSTGESSRKALLDKGFRLTKLFSPEHGLAAIGADGAFQKNGIDQLTGLQIISLYGEKWMPNEADLEEIDLLIFDLPDVGCRFYTYLWTMSFIMEACVLYKKPLIILDRPNPCGGNLSFAEGPFLDEENCASFIGRFSIPIRHCCTLGELALFFAETKMNKLDLQVVPIKNWNRNVFNEFSFVPPSPAIKNKNNILLYPGMGLLEGVNVHEGRGTNFPFELIAAPWIDGQKLMNKLLQILDSEIKMEPTIYKPINGIYSNEICNGIKINIVDETTFKPVQTGIQIIKTLAELYPIQLTERLYLTLANPTGQKHLDKLLGVKDSFNKIKNGFHFETNVAEIWQKMMQPYLLY